VRTPVLEALPGLEEDLAPLSAVLTREAMTGMLRDVVVDGEKPEAVAKRFLGDHDLLRQ